MSKQTFDMMAVKFGYNTFALPKAAAMALFEALQGVDVYRLDSRWDNGRNITMAELMELDSLPTLASLGPVTFHQALEEAKIYRQEQAKKNADK